MLKKRSKHGQQAGMLSKVLLCLTQLTLLVHGADYEIEDDYYC